jgi:hypothetical protein
MMLTSGTRLGPYELIVPIGAGGMDKVIMTIKDFPLLIVIKI